VAQTRLRVRKVRELFRINAEVCRNRLIAARSGGPHDGLGLPAALRRGTRVVAAAGVDGSSMLRMSFSDLPSCPAIRDAVCTACLLPCPLPCHTWHVQLHCVGDMVEHATCGRVGLVALPRVPHHVRAGNRAGRAAALCCAGLSASPRRVTTPPLARLRGLRPCRRRRTFGATTPISPPSRSEGGLQPALRALAFALGFGFNGGCRAACAATTGTTPWFPHSTGRPWGRRYFRASVPSRTLAVARVRSVPSLENSTCGSLLRDPASLHSAYRVAGTYGPPPAAAPLPCAAKSWSEPATSHGARKPRFHNLAMAQTGSCPIA